MSNIATWPTTSVGISFLSIHPTGIMVPSQPNNPALLPIFTEVGSRTRSIVCKRGKNYELDIPRGNLNTVVFENRNGDFDTTNSSGPYYPGLTTHKQLRFRAAYPVANANLLDPTNATGGDVYRFLPLMNILPQATVSLTTQTGTVLSGTYAYQSGYPATAVIGTRSWALGYGDLKVGTQYTFSVYAFSTSSLGFAAYADSYDKNSNLVNSVIGSTVTVAGAWSRLTVTFTPGAGSIASIFYIKNTATGPGSTFNLFTDQLQLEAGSSASTWITPTTPYPLMSGYIQSFKQYYDVNTKMGLTEVSVADILGPLSQTILLSAVGSEILKNLPTAYWPLTDAVAASSAGPNNTSASSLPWRAAPLLATGGGNVVKFGNTSILPGAPNDTCLNFDATATPGVSWTELELSSDTPVLKATSNENVALTLWFSTPVSTGAAKTIVQQMDNVVAQTDYTVFVDTTGVVNFSLRNQVTGATFDAIVSSGRYDDGKPHFVVAQVYLSNSRMLLHIDGVLIGDILRTGGAPSVGLNNSITRVGSERYGRFPFTGNISQIAAFSAPIGSTQVLSDATINSMNNGGFTAFTNERTDSRFDRIAAYALNNFVTVITPPLGSYQQEAGLTDSAGQSVLDSMNLCIQDESSNMYVAGEGWIVMEARHDRWRNVAASWTVGDAPGELPYLSTVDTELDDIKVVNSVTAQRVGGDAISVADQTSIYNHFTRTYPGSLLLKTYTDLDSLSIAQGIVWRNKEPMERLSNAEFDPVSNANLWPFVLGAQISQRVRYNRRPFGAPLKALDTWIESVGHSVHFDPGSEGQWVMTIEGSPGLPGSATSGLSAQAFLTTCARTTLHTSTIATATSFILNALPDAATNTSQSDGWTPTAITSITIWDGANTETLAVSTIATTTVGYTTFTLTTASSAAFAHSSGVTISESLVSTSLLGWTYNTFDSASIVDGSNVVTY